jgi:hypothetical protein
MPGYKQGAGLPVHMNFSGQANSAVNAFMMRFEEGN